MDSPIAPATRWRDEVFVLSRLALPAIISQVGLVLMGVVDVVLVGALGADALAGVGIGHAYGWGSVIVVLGVVLGLDPMLTQAVGARKPEAAGEAFVQGTAFGLLLSVPVAFAWAFAEPVLLALGQPPIVATGAADYCRALLPGLPALILFSTLRQFLQAWGDMSTVTAVILIANVVNGVLAWALIGGHLGAPALGITGAGLATALVRIGMAVALWLLARPRLRSARPRLSSISPPALLSLAKLTLPVGLQIGLEVWAFNAGSFMAGWISATAVAAHTVALNATSLSFMVALGLSQAGATRVGNLIGAGHPWRVTANTALLLTVIGELPAALLFTLLPLAAAAFYTHDPAVLGLAVSVLPLAGAFQVFDGLQAVLFGLLRGAGDTRVPALANIVGYWLIGLPLGGLLAFGAGWGLAGIWVGFLVALGTVATLLFWRIRHVIVDPVVPTSTVLECAADTLP